VQNSSSELGLQLVLFLQSLGDWLVYPMRFFTFLGQEEFFLLVMPAILWCISMSLGLRIGLILLLADNFRIILKLVFTTPRPIGSARKSGRWTSRAPSASLPGTPRMQPRSGECWQPSCEGHSPWQLLD
jgi:hypothetical protein